MKRFEITDDSGFLAVVNVDRYKTFVTEDWELRELMDHFIAEMNNDNLVIWGTGYGNIWSVAVSFDPATQPAFRECTKTIEVTAGRLYLTNYESLTMVASFAHCSLPPKHQKDNYFELPNGLYKLTIRQFCDPKDLDAPADPGFEIIVDPAIAPNRTEGVFWWKM